MKLPFARDIPPRAAAVVVALALLASIVTGREHASAPEPPPPLRPATLEAQPVPPQELQVDKLVRRRTEHGVQDLFASHSWSPSAPLAAPVPAVEPTPPPQPVIPVAPPLPFTYLGRMIRNERTLVYLLKGEDMLLVENGQTLGEYRIESIGDSAMSFFYVPSGTRQALSFPARE